MDLKCVLVLFSYFLCFWELTTGNKDFSSCKKLATNGYRYNHFFEISELQQHTPNHILDLKFYVEAPNNAHILLSPSSKVTQDHPVYEIVLGAGLNSFSDIRRQMRTNTKSTQRTANILSIHEAKPFWLRVSNDGLIEVGEEGEEVAFISWKDPDPLPIRYISFCTWTNVEAVWYFDCRERNESSDPTLVEVPVNLTDRERLESDLFKNYDSYIIPFVNDDRKVLVIMNFLNPRIIGMDEKKMTLSVEFDSTIKWIDPRLQWTKSTYGNISTLYYRSQKVWVPPLHLFNSAGFGNEIVHQKYRPLSVFYNSVIQWEPKITMKVWCTDSDLLHWPFDQHQCNFYLGVYPYADKVQFAESSSFSMEGLNQEFSEWQIINVTSESMNGQPIPGMLVDSIQKGEQYALTLKLTVHRKNHNMAIIFHSILFLTGVGMILTYCVSNSEFIKIGLICGQILLLVVTMLVMLTKMPIKSDLNVPKLLTFCEFGLIASTVSLIVSIMVIRIDRKVHLKPLPRFLDWVATCEVVQIVFVLPRTKNFAEYGKFSDKIGVPEKQTIEIQDLWTILGIFIDRIMFLIYIILIILFYVKYF